MHGCGNDYIFIDCIRNPLTEEETKRVSTIAKKLSDRENGIGADGLILIKPSQIADFEMEMYNADGSEGKMCGNGIRCVGKYVFDTGLTNKNALTIATKSGVKYLELMLQNHQVAMVRVNMGSPIVTPSHIPVVGFHHQKIILDYPLDVQGTFYQITCVSMGNPHTVVFSSNIKDIDLKQIGSQIEHHTMFPEQTNVEFVQIVDRDTIKMRVWERGSGETLACGTGACASVVASILHGYTNQQVLVHLLGGDLFIDYNREFDLVYMTGPAVTIYTGELVDETLLI